MNEEKLAKAFEEPLGLVRLRLALDAGIADFYGEVLVLVVGAPDEGWAVKELRYEISMSAKDLYGYRAERVVSWHGGGTKREALRQARDLVRARRKLRFKTRLLVQEPVGGF